MLDQILGPLIYEGQNFFRMRLILACLKGRTVKITNLRPKGEEIGIQGYEESFLNLLYSITNGSKIDMNESGTVIRFQPGIIYGGKIEHECPMVKGIGYYLEPLLMLAPFAKMPFDITLKGITNKEDDPSVDMIKASIIPVLKKFLNATDETLSLNIIKRGLPPKGGGVIQFKCPCVRSLKPFQWMDYGKVNKIRGIAFTSRNPPKYANKMMESAKEVFSNYLSDSYFTIESSRCLSPGYGISIVAKSNKDSCWTGEAINNAYIDGISEKYSPEALGKEAAFRVMDELHKGGCVDSLCTPIILLFMVCSPKDVSKAVLGYPSTYTMHFIKHLKDFFGVMFKLDDYEADKKDKLRTGAQKVVFTCLGTGYVNMSKGML